MRDDSMSLYEFVGRLYQHLKNFEGTLDEAQEKIDEFITRFDTKLDKTTEQILTEWKNDGTLAELINLVWEGKAEQILTEWKNDGTLEEIINLVWADKADKTYIDGLEQDFNQHKLDYANYIQSELDFVLRELPNGTKDEIRLSSGKAEKVQRVSDTVVLNSSDIVLVSTIPTNVDVAVIKKPANYIGFGNNKSPSNAAKDIIGDMIKGYEYVDNVSNIGYVYSADTTYLGLFIAKGTTLEQARQQLVGLTVTYQLAEPIITELALDDLSPNTQQIVKLSNKVEKLTNAIIALGGTIE